jgi:hypothetical protein
MNNPMYQKNTIFAASLQVTFLTILVSAAFFFASNTKYKGYPSNNSRVQKSVIVTCKAEKGSLSSFINFNFLLMQVTVKSQSSAAINEQTKETANILALNLVKETPFSEREPLRRQSRPQARDTKNRLLACIAEKFPELQKLKCKIVSCSGYTTLRANYGKRELFARAYTLHNAFVHFAQEYYLKVNLLTS